MSFKEFKKKDRIRTWENKLRRLYASEELAEEDLKYFNIQYDLYKMRKNNSKKIIKIIFHFYFILAYVWGFFGGGCVYLFPYINELHKLKRILLALSVGYLVYSKLRSKNRDHYERLLMPYFEKYYIK
jgi:hypothetical protein